MKNVRKEAIERSNAWWYCENLVNHRGMVALLRMDFPRVFVLMRDYSVAYFEDFDNWKSQIVELNFLDPEERETADIEGILIDAWNFLSLQEEADEALYEELRAEEDEDM